MANRDMLRTGAYSTSIARNNAARRSMRKSHSQVTNLDPGVFRYHKTNHAEPSSPPIEIVLGRTPSSTKANHHPRVREQVSLPKLWTNPLLFLAAITAFWSSASSVAAAETDLSPSQNQGQSPALTALGAGSSRTLYEGDLEDLYKTLRRAASQGHKRGLEALQSFAEKNDPEAHYHLGILYQNGKGVTKDTKKGVLHFATAFSLGHAKAFDSLKELASEPINNEDALLSLGLVFTKGPNKDLRKASQWYGKSAKLYGKSAKQGHTSALVALNDLAQDPINSADAQFELGTIFFKGLFKAQKHSSVVVMWYTKAAVQGHTQALTALKNIASDAINNAEAQFNLGTMYLDGLGVETNDVTAAKWYGKSAKQGNGQALDKLTHLAKQGQAEAQVNLGAMYDFGRGLDQDYRKAVEFYQKAEDQGHPRAQNALGAMYFGGYGGLNEDKNKALELYLKSANQGNAEAQFNLGGMYQKGIVFEKDIATAAEWYQKAADQGLEVAARALQELKAAKKVDKSSNKNNTKSTYYEWMWGAAATLAAGAASYLLGSSTKTPNEHNGARAAAKKAKQQQATASAEKERQESPVLKRGGSRKTSVKKAKASAARVVAAADSIHLQAQAEVHAEQAAKQAAKQVEAELKREAESSKTAKKFKESAVRDDFDEYLSTMESEFKSLYIAVPKDFTEEERRFYNDIRVREYPKAFGKNYNNRLQKIRAFKEGVIKRVHTQKTEAVARHRAERQRLADEKREAVLTKAGGAEKGGGGATKDSRVLSRHQVTLDELREREELEATIKKDLKCFTEALFNNEVLKGSNAIDLLYSAAMLPLLKHEQMALSNEVDRAARNKMVHDLAQVLIVPAEIRARTFDSFESIESNLQDFRVFPIHKRQVKEHRKSLKTTLQSMAYRYFHNSQKIEGGLEKALSSRINPVAILAMQSVNWMIRIIDEKFFSSNGKEARDVYQSRQARNSSVHGAYFSDEAMVDLTAIILENRSAPKGGESEC